LRKTVLPIKSLRFDLYLKRVWH